MEIDVLASGEFRMEPGPNLQERSDPSLDADPSGRLDGDPREDLQQRALAGAIASDDPEHLALLDVEGDVFQGKNVVVSGQFAVFSFFLTTGYCRLTTSPFFLPTGYCRLTTTTGLLRPVVHLSDLEIGVFLAADTVPPAVDVVRKRTSPDLPKAVEFAEVFDANYCVRHYLQKRIEPQWSEAT